MFILDVDTFFESKLVLCSTVKVRSPWMGCPEKVTFKFSEPNEPGEMREDNYRDRKELVPRDQPRALILHLN